MTLRLSCYHGHQLEITEDFSDAEFVCDRCGSVTVHRRTGDTAMNRFARTVDSIVPDADGDDADVKATDLRPSQDFFDPSDDGSTSLTLNYTPPTGDIARDATIESAGEPSREQEAGPAPPSSHERGEAEKFTPPQLPGYEVIEELGRGGMGVVYRARDLVNGRDVALKTLQRMNPDSLHQFKQEFRSLADIAHPNLASLYELVSDGETWCFTMEILEGVDFLQYVWSGFDMLGADDQRSATVSRIDEPRLTSERLERLGEAVQQLVIGLSALHNAGMLHSDIKPSNVLMTTEGRLVLLDFGLIVPIDRKAGSKKFIQGTPLYMSPEQARAQPLTPASDWYAVGVMLFELLTGRLPFRGRSTNVLKKKRIKDPPDPAQMQPGNPQALNDLCLALLDRDPLDRPSASDILRFFWRCRRRRHGHRIQPGDRRPLGGTGRTRQALTSLARRVRARGRRRYAERLRTWKIGNGQERPDSPISGRDRAEPQGHRVGRPVLRAGIGSLQSAR